MFWFFLILAGLKGNSHELVMMHAATDEMR